MSPSPTNLNAPAQRRRLARLLRTLTLCALIPYLALVMFFALLQRRLIYYPMRAAALPVAEFVLSASARDVTLTTSDGLTLHGWLLFAEPDLDREPADGGRTAEARPLVLYFPGNAGHRAYRIPDFQEFTRLGFDVLIFDYRGYAENPGAPSQQAMQADARAAWNFAVSDLHVAPARIVLFGESMGAAVAIHLAAELCNQSTPPAALITNAAFASLAGTAQWHYPWLPCQLLLLDQWRSVEHIPRITCPILMFHGARDSIVPLSQGRELFAAAPAQSAGGVARQFVELPANGHNDIPLAILHDQIASLVATVFPSSSQSRARQ